MTYVSDTIMGQNNFVFSTFAGNYYFVKTFGVDFVHVIEQDRFTLKYATLMARDVGVLQ